MVSCPKCGSRLSAFSQFWKFHDVTCPRCSAVLEVDKNSKVIMWVYLAVSAIIIGIIVVSPLFLNYTLFARLVVYIVIFCISAAFFSGAYYARWLKFRVKDTH